MIARRTKWLVAAFAGAAAMAVGGCSSGGPPEVDVAAGGYDEAFIAAREVLRDYRFSLDRVDARAGVISTEPKHSGGLLTPWDAEQTDLGDEVGDLLSERVRTVRVTFDRPGSAGDAAQPVEAADDLRLWDGPLTMRVRAVEWRRNVPGTQVQPNAVRVGTRWVDRDLVQRGMQPRYDVAMSEDDGLSRTLAAKIRRRIGK